MRGPRAGRDAVGGGVLALSPTASSDPGGRPVLLALRALGLGDFLTGVPAMRALRRAHPDHCLVLAAPSALRPLVDLAGVADQLLDCAGLHPLPWSGPPPALAVNLHGKGPQSHAVLSRLRPRRLVAFGCLEARHAGPRWDPEEHEVRRWCRLVEEDLGVTTDPTDLGLTVPRAPAAVPGAVVVHPGAAYPSRRWPAERFAAVARWLVERGYEVVVTGGPEERVLAGWVAEAAGLPATAVLAGRTDLDGLAAQVAAAPLVVCGDTGVAHLASAYRTPSVVLFGPTSPATWGPPEGGPHLVLWRGSGGGDPWGGEVDPALAALTVEEVLAAVARALDAVSPAGSRTTPGCA